MAYIFKKRITKILTAIILLIILIIIAGIQYTKPIHYHKVFSNALITTNLENISKITTLEIDGNLYKGELLKDLKIRKDLVGTILIDGKKYSLKGYNLGAYTNNIFFGELKENESDSTPQFMFFLLDDSNSIYLSGVNNQAYVVAPAKTMEEFQNIRNKINKK